MTKEFGKNQHKNVIASDSEAIQKNSKRHFSAKLISSRIELLAPAKDKECAIAAIDCGADAIYIGASEFGARKNAPNSLLDIEEIVNYAHQFNAKVYVTINTILTDEEIEKAQGLIAKLDKIGVDAVIIQDLGLLNYPSPAFQAPSPLGGEGKKNAEPEAPKSPDSFSLVPWGIGSNFETKNEFQKFGVRGIEYHASTQCDNRTIEKVKFLESIGFTRVVLARELSLEQIKEIHENTNVELEAFIHGALCVSYSGQCYMSYAIGDKKGCSGRSANRGECAQPCRKKYSLQDEKGNFIVKDKHLLCLKDFNASKHIKELAQAGVTSFKIEGRLKDVNYVKNVVAYYRKLIDDLGLEKSSSGKVLLDFEPNLEKSFNRGFTNYFLKGRTDCFNFDSPKSKGEYIGKISKVGKDFFEINILPRPVGKRVEVRGPKINPQDGLCFFDGKDMQGFLVNKVENNKIYPNKMENIKSGTEIYRNFDAEFEKQLKNTKTSRKIEASIIFELNKISVIDEDGKQAEIRYDFEELAQNSSKMNESIIKQLSKSGDTIFLINDVKINSDKLPFLPVSKLNELRRELLEELKRARIESKKADSTITKLKTRHSNIQPFNRSPLDYRANILNNYAKDFYKNLGFEISEMALESGINCKGKIVMTTKHCIKHSLGMCKSAQRLFLIDEKGKRYELKFDCKKCEMNIIF